MVSCVWCFGDDDDDADDADDGELRACDCMAFGP